MNAEKSRLIFVYIWRSQSKQIMNEYLDRLYRFLIRLLGKIHASMLSFIIVRTEMMIGINNRKPYKLNSNCQGTLPWDNEPRLVYTSRRQGNKILVSDRRFNY